MRVAGRWALYLGLFSLFIGAAVFVGADDAHVRRVALSVEPIPNTGPGAGHFAQYDSQVTPLLERMTLAEKIGQMTQADLSFLGDLSDIETYSLGSVLSGGNADPPEGNSLANWTATYNACQKKSLKTRLAIPLLYGVDAVHGHSNVLDAVIFPHNIGLGCANDETLTEEIGRITALEVRATGIQWTFAPCVTVPRDDRWGRTYEGFSESPERVAPLGAAMVRGLQGDDLKSPTSILACVKHFVGDGGTTAEPRDTGADGLKAKNRLKLDQGDTRCDLETLRKIHLAPYLPSIAAGAGTIMPSYSSWNGVKCSASKELLTDILKEELGFEGFLISDYNAIDQCHPDYKTAIGISINAGMDMAMVPENYRKFITLLTELVEEGTVPLSRIDDAVRRILRVKAATGLLDDTRNQLAEASHQEGFGSPERREVARQAVRQSLVLLKNQGNLLPLSRNAKRIHVAGVAADDIGIQCGGWTIDWQGAPGEVTTGGTTILEGLRQVGKGQAGNGIEFSFSEKIEDAKGADAIILVVGEKPYAEFQGDNADLTLSDEDHALITKFHETGTPVVLILLSGRPMVLGEALTKSDAVVAAWLPGTEGQGIADMLLGDFSPTGTLSFTWPHSASQHPINDSLDRSGEQQGALFEFGYGLTF